MALFRCLNPATLSSVDGAKVLTGELEPTSTIGTNGDIYLQTGSKGALLHFDEDFTDEGEHTWTANGDFTISAAQSKFGGKSGYSSGAYLQTPESNDFEFGTNDFTFACWVYPTVQRRMSIFAYSSDYRIALDIFYKNNSIGMWASSTGSSWNIAQCDNTSSANSGAGTIAININEWTHIAYTRKGNKLRTFVNGVLNKELTISDNVSLIGGANFRIGAWANTSINYTGYIDEFLMLNGICLWENDFTPPTEPMTLPTVCKKAFRKIDNTWVEIEGTGIDELGSFENPYAANLKVLNGTATPSNDLGNDGDIYLRSGEQNYGTLLPFDTDFNDVKGIAYEAIGDAVLSDTQSKFGGKSLYLNGSSFLQTVDYVDSENFDLTSDEWTISYWMYTTSSARQTVMSFASTVFGIGVNSGKVGVWLIYNGSSFWSLDGSGSTSVALNTWMHVACTKQNNVLKLYVNGQLSDTWMLTGQLIPIGNSNKLRIGNWDGGVNYYFQGYIDDFLLLKNKVLWTDNFTPPTEPISPNIFSQNGIVTSTYQKVNGAWQSLINSPINEKTIVEPMSIWSGTDEPTSLLGKDNDIYLKYYKTKAGKGVVIKEYLQSPSGYNYIDTGYVAKRDSKLIMECTLINGQTYWSPFGARELGDVSAAAKGVYSMSADSNKIGYSFGGPLIQKTGSDYSTYRNKKVRITLCNGRYLLENIENGTVLVDESFALQNEFTQYPIYLFCLDQGGSPYSNYTMTYMKLYNFKIYEGDELVHYYLPSVNENKACLYDIVDKEYLYNSYSTDTFIAGGEPAVNNIIYKNKIKINNQWQDLIGSDIEDIFFAKPVPAGIYGYTQLSYIKSDGSSYINSKLRFTTDTEFEIGGRWNDISSTAQVFFGIWTSGGESLYGALQGKHWAQIGGTGTSNTVALDSSYHVFSANANGIYIDENSVGTPTWSNVPTGYNIPILARQDGGSGINCQATNFEFGYCKIWQGGDLIRDFVPCKRNYDNAIGLYDKVNDKFYQNNGTGEIIAGPVVTGGIITYKNYIHFTDGIGFILPFTINADYKITVVFNDTTYKLGNAIIDNTYDSKYLRFGVYNQTSGDSYYSSRGTQVDFWGTWSSGTHTFICNNGNRHNVFDGVEVASYTPTTLASAKIVIGGGDIHGEVQRTSPGTYISRFKIESLSTGEVICDLRPAIQGQSTHCMYDIINDIAYTSSGLEAVDDIN